MAVLAAFAAFDVLTIFAVLVVLNVLSVLNQSFDWLPIPRARHDPPELPDLKLRPKTTDYRQADYYYYG